MSSSSSRGLLYRLSRGLHASPAGRTLKRGARALFPALYYRLYEQTGAGNAPSVPPSAAEGTTPPAPERWTERLSDAERDDLFVVRTFDATPEVIRANAARNEAFLRSGAPVRSVNWFIPAPEHAMFAGVRTILRFAERLQTAHGVENRIVIYNLPHISPEKVRGIEEAVPSLKGRVLVYSGERPLDDEIPAADAAVATLWTSAYYVAPLRSPRATFYFVQDYEPLFYAGGSTSGVCEATYRMGFVRIANTPGLLEHVVHSHGGGGTSFVPAIDRAVYYRPDPATDPRFAADGRQRPVRIFFYARPKESRNGFLLGLEALRHAKAKYGDRVDIVTAGGAWDERDYGVENVLKNLGRLASLEEVADLYRSCDVGLVFMFSKHPSYQPFEFMACGCCVVTNTNDATTWLLRDGENAVVTDTPVSSVAASIGRLVEDPGLRRRLADSAYHSLPTAAWDDIIDDTLRRAGLLPAACADGVPPSERTIYHDEPAARPA